MMISVADLQDNDVICGRSSVAHTHTGNKLFRSLIQEHGFLYQSRKLRSLKRSVTMEVINAIQSNGGRFLKATEKASKNNPDTFEVAEFDFIYEKCSHALRSYQPTRALKQVTMRKKQPTTESEYSLPIAHVEIADAARFVSLYKSQQEHFKRLSSSSEPKNDLDMVDQMKRIMFGPEERRSQLSGSAIAREVSDSDSSLIEQQCSNADIVVAEEDDDAATVLSFSSMDLKAFDLTADCGTDRDFLLCLLSHDDKIE